MAGGRLTGGPPKKNVPGKDGRRKSEDLKKGKISWENSAGRETFGEKVLSPRAPSKKNFSRWACVLPVGLRKDGRAFNFATALHNRLLSPASSRCRNVATAVSVGLTGWRSCSDTEEFRGILALSLQHVGCNR